MTKKIFGCTLLVVTFMAGSYAGFIGGVEAQKDDIAKRSVSMGSCTLVFQ